jgi:hypothetical protein
LFLLIHRASGAYWVAVAVGLGCGLVNCVYANLMLRACPKGLEGAAVTFVTAIVFIAWLGSDLFGAWLYRRGGFALALWVTTGLSLLMLPILPRIPRPILAGRDGEPLPDAAGAYPATG